MRRTWQTEIVKVIQDTGAYLSYCGYTSCHMKTFKPRVTHALGLSRCYFLFTSRMIGLYYQKYNLSNNLANLGNLADLRQKHVSVFSSELG